jgi:hypothetical protein
MSSGISRRRTAKAQRRKKVLAERRGAARGSAGPSRTERMRRAASAPLHACLVQDGLFERGNGTLILARRRGAGTLSVSLFLLDVYCLGIKDAFFREAGLTDFEVLIESCGAEAPFADVEPSYARKLLRDLAAYARSIGMEPAEEYAASELLFGDIRADDCDVDFQFGFEGKPLYIPGPTDTPAQINRRIKQMEQHLGEDGFVFASPFDDFGDESFDDDFDDDVLDEDLDDDLDDEADDDWDAPGYDPDVAPDPAAWLALDEGERVYLVRAYHKRAGIRGPKASVHATIHAVVENQAALGDELPVRRTIERLMTEGLDRHEAIHAIGSVLIGRLFELAKDESADTEFSQAAYNAEIERLTAESWRASFEDDDEAP